MTAAAPLNPRGEERARQLAVMLKDAEIRAAYVTEVRRVQQTAEPTAQEFHLKPIIIPQKDVDALVSRLKSLPDGETVLVVSHADTIPTIVEKLGAITPAMCDSEYDRMLVITTGKGRPAVLTLRYGNAAY